MHFLGNFPLVRLVDQRRRQMEVIFYSQCCIMGSGVGILASKIRLAMTVVVESWITYYRLDHMVWPSNLHWLDQMFLIQETFFSLKCACLGASLNTLCNFYWKLHFPAIYNMQNYKIFCPSGPSDETKISKFLPFNFSWYNFENFIRTLKWLWDL